MCACDVCVCLCESAPLICLSELVSHDPVSVCVRVSESECVCECVRE